MDMSIARASMSMANAQIGAQVRTSVMKNALDVYEQGAEDLLKSMGMGQNISIQA